MLWIEKPYTKIACITDPHAHLATLQALIAQIPPDYQIIVLGDMIDKGFKSKEVVQLVKDNYDALLGNHDHFMTVESNPNRWKRYQSVWFDLNNGKLTHASYGDKWKIKNIAENKVAFHQHVVYLKSLPLVIELPNLFVNGKRVVLSHSSIGPAVEYFGGIEKLKEFLKTKERSELLSDYDHDDIHDEVSAVQSIMWSDVTTVDALPSLGVLNVMGHTVQKDGIVKLGENGAFLDCGVYNEGGTLNALLLPEMKIITQQRIIDPRK